jgi:hypothetical protein
MEQIAFDESGNTGADLLDKRQPVFILASVKMTLEQAEELKSIFEVSGNAPELKFNKLKKYGKHHFAIEKLLNHEYINPETVRLSVFHKEYCIWVHTVDRIIEHMLYKAGIDVYENGLNIAMTNFFHFCAPVFCNKEVVDDYKKSFNKLFRDRDNSSILEFFVVTDYLKNSCIDNDFRKILEIITDGTSELDSILENFNSSHFDSYLTAFIYQINFWGQKTSSDFDVYVDKYKNWAHFTKHLEMIKNIKDEQTIGTDRRTLNLPLKLNNVIETDSSENSVVQIADLMAGIANHYFKCIINGNNEDELFKKLNEEKINSFIQTMVWPHKAFTPEETDAIYTDGENALDSLARLSFKNKK